MKRFDHIGITVADIDAVGAFFVAWGSRSRDGRRRRRVHRHAFEVTDVETAVDRVAEHGFSLVGGIGEYEGVWRMAYVRGPEGLLVSLSERRG